MIYVERDHMHDFKKLIVFQKALDFSRIIRKTTRMFPKDELFGLTSQFRRAADSIVLNITEGAGNSTKKEFSRFLDIAIRSGFECVGCLDIVRNNENTSKEEYEILLLEIKEITAMLYGLKKSLTK